MIPSPLFSVIIPTFNRAKLLKKAIQSVQAQTFNDWELLIVDDGSTDETVELAKTFPNSRIRFFFQTHRERSAARNLGIAQSSGSYLCFLDDDDYFLPNHLQVFFEALSRDQFPQKIYRNGYFFERGNRRRKGPVYHAGKHRNPARFAAFNFCGVWSLCIPKSFLEENAFPETFPYWEDTHLILRLFTQHELVQNEEFTYIHRLHPHRSSELDYTDSADLRKVELNVQAMRHFFYHQGQSVLGLLPSWTGNYLVAEKYLEYAGNALPQRAWQASFRFLFRSIRISRFRFLRWRYLKFLLKMPFTLVKSWMSARESGVITR